MLWGSNVAPHKPITQSHRRTVNTLHFSGHVQSEIASTLHFTFWGLGMGETDITNKSNLDITRRIEWGLQNYQLE